MRRTTPLTSLAAVLVAAVLSSCSLASSWGAQASWGDPPSPTYAEARAEAVKESKPLVVWVGYHCPSSAVQVPGMVHHHVPGDRWERWTGPGVVVGVPGGDGELYHAAFIGAADCCATNIRAAVEATVRRWESGTSPTASAPPGINPSFLRHVRGWAASTNGQCVG